MATAARVLSPAQQTADQAIADARREADETLGRARREADEVLTKARRQAEQITGDARARAESEPVILRHLAHFSSGHTSGYLGTVNAGRNDYDGLLRDVILHGSPATVTEKIERLRAIGADSLMLHYPPWYGAEKAIGSLELFAREVMPKFAGRASEASARKVDGPDEAQGKAHVARI